MSDKESREKVAKVCLKWMQKFSRHDDGNHYLAADEIISLVREQFVERACAVADSLIPPLHKNANYKIEISTFKQALRDEFMVGVKD